MDKSTLDILMEESERVVTISGKKINLPKLSPGQILKITGILSTVASNIYAKLINAKTEDRYADILVILKSLNEDQVADVTATILNDPDIEKCKKLSAAVVSGLFVYVVNNDMSETLKNFSGIDLLKTALKK